MHSAVHLSAHEPLLVNLLGHSAGALIFGTFYVLLGQAQSPWRPKAAAAAAVAWNTGSLFVLFAGGQIGYMQQWVVALATSALSLLPALLLDISFGARQRWAAVGGYLVSGLAVLLHLAELWVKGPELHAAALVLTASGFAGLTLLAAALELRRQASVSQAVGAMALILFALSFSHFHAGGGSQAWSYELIVHHAGIPLALFILLQDYRFVFLDAFLRFLANGLLAMLFLAGLWVIGLRLEGSSRERAVGMVLTFAAFVLFGISRNAAQRLLTSVLFRREDPARVSSKLRILPASGEEEFIQSAAQEVAGYFRAQVCAPEKAEALIAVRLGEGMQRTIGLAYRQGGRRFLSEDLSLLTRFGDEISHRLEALREAQLRQLVAQAELRALQSQIHPHFLFNALNTLYGLIPKTATGARQTVLNLSDILRFFFRTTGAEVPLQEEIRIVEAYLAIESLRLGDKLQYTVDTPPETLPVPVPVLTIQPLVENAVRHGVSPQPGGGEVRVAARLTGEVMEVLVEDNGPGFPAKPPASTRPHVGLENVRQRLALRYGNSDHLTIQSAPGRTVVRLKIPTGGAR